MDFDSLYKAINRFQFSSKPSNADSSASCTNGDIIKVVNNLSDVLRTLVSELEQND